MAFTTEPTVTATEIKSVTIHLVDYYDETATLQHTANFDLDVLRSDGSMKRIAGNLVPHITTVQRDALIAFMVALRSQAETQVLP